MRNERLNDGSSWDWGSVDVDDCAVWGCVLGAWVLFAPGSDIAVGMMRGSPKETRRCSGWHGKENNKCNQWKMRKGSTSLNVTGKNTQDLPVLFIDCLIDEEEEQGKRKCVSASVNVTVWLARRRAG